LARVRPALSTQALLGAEHLDARLGVVRQALLGQHGPGAGKNRLARSARLGRRLRSDDRQEGGISIAVSIGRTDLAVRARRPPPGTRDPHAIGAIRLEPHGSEVTADIRQEVAARITDLVQELLTHSGWGHQAPGARRLRDDEAAV